VALLSVAAVTGPPAPASSARPEALRVFITCVALAISVQGAPATTSAADEYRVKAAVVYNIARFVDWPSAAFAEAGSPLVVCVVGVDPFGSALDDALQGRTVKGRPVEIRRSHDLGVGCHVVFIAFSEHKRVEDIIYRLGSTAALSISEVDRFTHRGGIIGLRMDGSFDINATAADRANLTMSARLLALASSVRVAGGAGR
jgi:YfiR/HmsC-like